MRRKVGLALAIVGLVFITAIVAVGPGFVDISKPARASVIRQLEKITGREVSLGSDLHFPKSLASILVATDVAIANISPICGQTLPINCWGRIGSPKPAPL